jgi:signal transduction histidine kinase
MAARDASWSFFHRLPPTLQGLSRTLAKVVYGFRLLQWLEDMRKSRDEASNILPPNTFSPPESGPRADAGGSGPWGEPLTILREFALVENLVASAAHEIRNPLTSIKLWMYSIQEAVRNDPDLDRKCCLVAEEVDRLERIVSNFLELARRPQLAAVPCEVDGLVEKTLEILRPTLNGVAVHVDLPGSAELPRALIDPDQFRQVLINLLTNSVEALGGHGNVRISLGIEVVEEGRRMVVVKVQDNGLGIPETIRDRIFEPFVTSKENGTGLGLCIARRIMENNGGRLSVEVAGGPGTSVAAYLPAEESEVHG